MRGRESERGSGKSPADTAARPTCRAGSPRTDNVIVPKSRLSVMDAAAACGTSENSMVSTMMWPQPPVSLSTISIRAVLPARLATFHVAQPSVSEFLPGRRADDLAVDPQVDAGRARMVAAADAG